MNETPKTYAMRVTRPMFVAGEYVTDGDTIYVTRGVARELVLTRRAEFKDEAAEPDNVNGAPAHEVAQAKAEPDPTPAPPKVGRRQRKRA